MRAAGFHSRAVLVWVAACLAMLACVLGIPACLAQVASQPPKAAPDMMLDRVIAVVNTQIILASDLDLELRLGRLIPAGERIDSTEAQALDRLTTRALIEQQILQEDPKGLAVPPTEVKANLDELKQSLPACKQHDCVSPAGWAAYLATLGLTPQRVEAYWTERMAVLRFIELRFRAGIEIEPADIQKYYDETMLPQYARREDAPSLDRISPRIQEVLLQQRVNALLTEWLKSLQDQGQVEILDPVLRAAVEAGAAKAQGKGGSR
jgi:hypothetical protein